MKIQPSEDLAPASPSTEHNPQEHSDSDQNSGNNKSLDLKINKRQPNQSIILSETDLQINPSTCAWTAKTISFLEKVLKVNFKLHHTEGRLREGSIFLFNHFARFETFIPQYLIYRETGILSRSIASAEFFKEDDAFSKYLLSVGAVPTEYPDVVNFLASEVLRGRKIIIFPEGGMVKDRRVLDSKGRYRVYSRSAKERRKHHTGAAVIGLLVEMRKAMIRGAEKRDDRETLESWAEELGIESVDALVHEAQKPTLIIPSNITFYPIRITGNFLKKGVELFKKGLSPRLAEELLIEGNILLKHTDMDICLGAPVRPLSMLTWFDRQCLEKIAGKHGPQKIQIDLRETGKSWKLKIWAARMKRRSLKIRDRYMVEMYAGVSINLSHLASSIIFGLLDRGITETSVERFHRILYLAIKYLQPKNGVHLHRSIGNPEAYLPLPQKECLGLKQLIQTAADSHLVSRQGQQYHFLDKLRQEHGFDEIRIENLVAVYANEVEPISQATRSVEAAIRKEPTIKAKELALLRFDDEERSFHWDKARFHKPRCHEINEQETATLSGSPFLFLPNKTKKLGILLVHGFTASPAEVLPFGEKLRDLGYPVLGARLKGHGTSPCDLRERRWEDWLESTKRSHEILSALAPRTCLVGFSTGALLSLMLAADKLEGLAGAVVIAPPIKVKDKAMTFVPFMHGANTVARTMSGKGIMPYHRSNPEHIDINYRNMPIQALYELGQLIKATEDRLAQVECPCLILQSTDDQTVDPKSARIVYESIGSAKKNLIYTESNRHGILYENTNNIQEKILKFISEIEKN